MGNATKMVKVVRTARRVSDMLIRTNELERTGEMRGGCHVLRLVRQ